MVRLALLWQITLIVIQMNPPFVLGGSFCAKGVQPNKLLRMKSGESSLRLSAYL